MEEKEMTVYEELGIVLMEQARRDSISKKIKDIEQDRDRVYGYLHDAHIEIDKLNRAIVEQAKVIAELSLELKRRG